MQVKSVCLFHRIFAFLFMKYHKFYTFCLDFVERDGKAGGFCGGRAPPRPPPRHCVPAPPPALRATPHPRRAAYRLPCGQPRTPLRRSRCQNWLAGLPGRLLCGSPLTPPRRLPCGQPRTPLRCSRCQNWPDGPDGTSCHAGIPAPSPAAHVAFFFIGPGGVCLATYLPG